MRNAKDKLLLTLLVVRLYPSGLWFVTVADRKGRDDALVERLSKCIIESGLANFA